MVPKKDRGLKGLGFIQRFDTDRIFVDTEVRYPSLFSDPDSMRWWCWWAAAAAAAAAGARARGESAAARGPGPGRAL